MQHQSHFAGHIKKKRRLRSIKRKTTLTVNDLPHSSWPPYHIALRLLIGNFKYGAWPATMILKRSHLVWLIGNVIFRRSRLTAIRLCKNCYDIRKKIFPENCILRKIRYNGLMSNLIWYVIDGLNKFVKIVQWLYTICERFRQLDEITIVMVMYILQLQSIQCGRHTNLYVLWCICHITVEVLSSRLNLSYIVYNLYYFHKFFELRSDSI